jgi:hypothetical protein
MSGNFSGGFGAAAGGGFAMLRSGFSGAGAGAFLSTRQEEIRACNP